MLLLSRVVHGVEKFSKVAPHFRDYFYVGGEYVHVSGSTRGTYFHNQMYVEKLSPVHEHVQPYPIVFVHGGGQSGTNFLNKPDGSPGWASWFLNHGYAVYLLDRTLTGRSPILPGDDLSQTAFSAEFISQRFTAVQKYPLWPQAKLHTQWPGTGEMGDAFFDAYYMSTVQSVSDSQIQEETMKAAGERLLDRIGPAVVITHSQGGLYGWSWADSRPGLIKALIQIEPKGPPFREVIFSSAYSRPWGLTSIPLAYDPPPTNLSSPLTMKSVPADSHDLLPCIIQQEPPKKLPNLARVPILISTGEASYHALYDYCFIKFLHQAGVPAEHLELSRVGLNGNGHLHFMERNSDDIAQTLHEWVVVKVNGTL
ncbi:Alpha/beta hydrolase family-domain-containing protein [Aspergillus pseudonomiae]|uniref:Alpha/beta hydrolase family-domain-containing protein n=1 Tax=Aspergillus pseudonomiae TaxID=1506151 RepID=A0A5N6IDB4_9EURO|nr:Alpha/beta hydrolase family-domain-containing protein [Aspergillus pseudonomiae]KAB8263033.1 Alpha/beta hydrolase family-domain-containing protein [Aspergillus pseudonomiae]KAE8408720.1 Alpha/beta hydrolase family-domain-containing protein [Aspergillus pseudonomiae]